MQFETKNAIILEKNVFLEKKYIKLFSLTILHRNLE